MKKTYICKIMALLQACVMALTVTACGDNDQSKSGADAINGVYEALLKNSSYNEAKGFYDEYYPGSKLTEKLDNDKITITLTGVGDDTDGSWDYVLDGDYISFTDDENCYTDNSIFSYICSAVGAFSKFEDVKANSYEVKIMGNGDRDSISELTEYSENYKYMLCTFGSSATE